MRKMMRQRVLVSDVILHYLGCRPREIDSWCLFFLYSDIMLA